MAIKSIELLGCYESDKISVKSMAMKEAVMKFYGVSEEKIEVFGSDSISNVNGIKKLLKRSKR